MASIAKSMDLKEKDWNYQLTNGFKIYWEQRQKARPLPLWLIQTLFGNCYEAATGMRPLDRRSLNPPTVG